MTVMTALRAKGLERRNLEQLAGWLATGVAVSLPWSTSATAILIVLWLVCVVPTLDAAAMRRELTSAAGGLPVLLWVLAAVGMVWADVAWHERFGGLGGFNRLLVIPLLLAQFRRSEHGNRVFYGFFASVLVVMIVSWALVLLPWLSWRGKMQMPGIPVKNYISQSIEFSICAFVLLGLAFERGQTGRWRSVVGVVALAGLFLANIFFVVTGRTALLIVPLLALLLGWRQFGWKGLFGAGALGCLVGATVWLASPYLRERLVISLNELRAYETSDAYNSTGLHLEFLKKSLSFVEAAPIIGHGTGSIPEQFQNAAIGETGSAAEATVNPHNQIFAVAIQLGLVGAAVLVAMWLAHFVLFWGGGLTAWIGMVVVVQNVVSSLFNSHLFDFSEGWLYVFGVGVAGGMALRQRDAKLAAPSAAKP
jgi:O-antigen ligase